MIKFGDNPQARAELDTGLRDAVSSAIKSDKVSITEVVFLLARMLPELCDQSYALGHITGAYKMAESNGVTPAIRFNIGGRDD